MPDVIKSAVISDCGNYRYSLTRQWDKIKQYMVFVMLNPSTADAYEDDPTIRRCMSFAQNNDYGAIHVVNLFAYRTPSPKALKTSMDEIIGSENRRYIEEAMDLPGIMIAAWGNHGSYTGQGAFITSLITSRRHLYCFGVTKTGQPRHPLYLPSNAQLSVYKWAEPNDWGFGDEGEDE